MTSGQPGLHRSDSSRFAFWLNRQRAFALPLLDTATASSAGFVIAGPRILDAIGRHTRPSSSSSSSSSSSLSSSSSYLKPVMAAMVARPPQLGQRPSQRSSTSAIKVKTSKAVAVSISSAAHHNQAQVVPNKHLQSLSPGLPPPQAPDTPPESPTTRRSSLTNLSSPLYPPGRFHVALQSPAVYAIDIDHLAAAIEHCASQSLPDAKAVFPWLHGLHPLNSSQLNFFGARRRSSRKAPKSLRSVTIVKAGGDLSCARLKSAVAPAELLADTEQPDPAFLDVDPPQGFSVRNFHIQACKMATVSDVVLYRDDTVSHDDLLQLARRFAIAQRIRKVQESPTGRHPPPFNTFVLSSKLCRGRGGRRRGTTRLIVELAPFEQIETEHPELVAIDSTGQMTGKVLDFGKTWLVRGRG